MNTDAINAKAAVINIIVRTITIIHTIKIITESTTETTKITINTQ